MILKKGTKNMIKYCNASEDELGFLLNYNVDNGIITAKVLLILPDTDTCIDIISTPLPEDRRVISIPDWNLSYIRESLYSDDFSFVRKNDSAAPYKEILSITVEVMHDIIYSGLSDDCLTSNDMFTFESSRDSHFGNQYLPF